MPALTCKTITDNVDGPLALLVGKEAGKTIGLGECRVAVEEWWAIAEKAPTDYERLWFHRFRLETRDARCLGAAFALAFVAGMLREKKDTSRFEPSAAETGMGKGGALFSFCEIFGRLFGVYLLNPGNLSGIQHDGRILGPRAEFLNDVFFSAPQKADKREGASRMVSFQVVRPMDGSLHRNATAVELRRFIEGKRSPYYWFTPDIDEDVFDKGSDSATVANRLGLPHWRQRGAAKGWPLMIQVELKVGSSGAECHVPFFPAGGWAYFRPSKNPAWGMTAPLEKGLRGAREVIVRQAVVFPGGGMGTGRSGPRVRLAHWPKVECGGELRVGTTGDSAMCFPELDKTLLKREQQCVRKPAKRGRS